MAVQRIVPNITSHQTGLSRDFYVKLLGLQVGMDLGWIATYVSPANPKAQVSILRAEEGAATQQTISVEVDDVDRVHADAVAAGYEIVYPLTDESWGVRRFWVKDPNGVVINVVRHSAA